MSAKGIPQISVVFGGCTAGGAYADRGFSLAMDSIPDSTPGL